MNDDTMTLGRVILMLWGISRIATAILLTLLRAVWALTLQLRLWWQPA